MATKTAKKTRRTLTRKEYVDKLRAVERQLSKIVQTLKGMHKLPPGEGPGNIKH